MAELPKYIFKEMSQNSFGEVTICSETPPQILLRDLPWRTILPVTYAIASTGGRYD